MEILGGKNTSILISTVDWCLNSYLLSGTEERLQILKATKMMEETSRSTPVLFPEESKKAFSRSTKSENLFPLGWICGMDPWRAKIQLHRTHLRFQTQKPSFHAGTGISYRPQRSRAHQCIHQSAAPALTDLPNQGPGIFSTSLCNF